MIGCLRKIVSGGQTGADRGGLDAAIAHGLEIGGWAPQGFRAEDGVIPERYRVHMRESVSPNYGLRTRLNVQDSDGTLLLSFADKLTGGSKFTGDQLKHQRKPCKHLVLPRGRGVVPVEVTLALWDWLEEKGIAVLNIAGPRESKERGLQAAVERVIGDLLKAKASAATSAVLAFCDARDAANWEPAALTFRAYVADAMAPTKAEEDHLFRSAFAFASDCAHAIGVEAFRGDGGLIERYYEMPGNGAGGSLHVVLDDGNHERSSVEFCLNYAIKDGDKAGEALARALLALPDDVFEQVLPPFVDRCLDCGAEHPHLCPRAEDSDPEPYHRDEEPRE